MEPSAKPKSYTQKNFRELIRKKKEAKTAANALESFLKNSNNSDESIPPPSADAVEAAQNTKAENEDVVPIKEKNEAVKSINKNTKNEKQENDTDYELEKDTSKITYKYKYDPEYGNEISDRKQMITLLKKALKELEAEQRKQDLLEGRKFPLPKSLYELLINYVLNDKIDLNTILSLEFEGWNKTRSRTSLFEALWIIVISLGCLERFPIENIQLYNWI